MWPEELEREGVDGELDEAECGFNDFAVVGGDEDGEGGEELGVHVFGN